MFLDIDVRPILPLVDVPTLVLHRRGDRAVNYQASKWMAEQIPGAKYVELEGIDHAIFAGDIDTLLDEVEEFLTGVRRTVEVDRVLATVMFTDIVDSTKRASAMGDKAWRALLDAQNDVLRRELARYRGREIKTLGDGMLATFDGPARAIRCARAMTEAVRPLGIEIRVGLHTGEVELVGDDVAGHRRPHRRPGRRAGRAGRGARLGHGQGPGGRLRHHLRRPGRARPQGHPGPVADLRGQRGSRTAPSRPATVATPVVAAARAGEALAEQEGIREVVAEIAWIYLGIGLPDDARRLASTFDERVLAGLPRDHNYLLILQLLLDVALATGLDEMVETITPLLLPYAGRAVINAGGVMFHGVTDDTLARACDRLGDTERAAALREKALATYRRIGATWWRERLEADQPTTSEPEPSTAMTLRPGPAGVWFVGRADQESAIPARRGLEHLHALLTRPRTEVAALQRPGERDRGTGRAR